MSLYRNGVVEFHHVVFFRISAFLALMILSSNHILMSETINKVVSPLAFFGENGERLSAPVGKIRSSSAKPPSVSGYEMSAFYYGNSDFKPTYGVKPFLPKVSPILIPPRQ